MADDTDQAQGTPIVLQLTPDEIALICEALDSHIFWQLSDPHYREDGYVRSPGSDAVEKSAVIAEAAALLSRLEPFLREGSTAESS